MRRMIGMIAPTIISIQNHVETNPGDMEAMGKALLTSHSMVFELISLVLLIAIIGALVLARRGRN